MNRPHRPHRLAAALVLPWLALCGPSRADDFSAKLPPLPAYQQECAACHVAYPPQLLGAASWDRLMRGLPRHFGTDASLDAAQTRQIADWLAATRCRPPSPAATGPHGWCSNC